MRLRSNLGLGLLCLVLAASGCDSGESGTTTAPASSVVSSASSTVATTGPGGSGGQGGEGAQGGQGGAPECDGNEDCDDTNACTTDTCTVGDCSNVAIDCDDDLFCNGLETCDAQLGCQSPGLDPDDGVPCTDDSCDETNDVIVNTANDANCDDNIGCTDDVCDEIDDCSNTANNANCDDAVACTSDVCDAVNDCIITPDPTMCTDPAGCMIAVCDAVTGCGVAPDNAACDDTDTCTTDVCDPVDDCLSYATTVACGDVVISEIMQHPAATTATVGEWFEVTNVGTYDFNLGGCTIQDDGSDSHVIAGDLIVPQAGRATLARSLNPGFTPDYVFTGTQLADGLDELVIVCGGQELARVNWDDGVLFPDPNGASMTLHADAFTFGESLWGRHWCEGTTSYNGDLGTPGALNDPCPTIYVMDLTEGQEVPPTGDTALGQCTVTLNAAQTQLSVSCTHNVVGANAAHIHLGAVGVNGGVVIDLGNGLSPITATSAVTPADVSNLLAGSLYINVHSVAFPGGAIRGQIVPATLYTHYLTGAEEVPPVPTTAIGVCVHALPFGESFFDAWCTHSAVGANAAHIHNAPFGVNGGILVGFGSFVTPINERVPTNAAFLTELDLGNLYINVHTMANPGGEIRGQIP